MEDIRRRSKGDAECPFAPLHHILNETSVPSYKKTVFYDFLLIIKKIWDKVEKITESFILTSSDQFSINQKGNFINEKNVDVLVTVAATGAA